MALTLAACAACEGRTEAPDDARAAVAPDGTSSDLGQGDATPPPDGHAPSSDVVVGWDRTPEPSDAGPPPPNRTCATARALREGGESVMAEGVNRGLEAPAACGTGETPALWYRVRVPARHHLTASALDLSASNGGVTVRALRGCDGACLPRRGSNERAVRWTNDGSDVDVMLALAPAGAVRSASAHLTVSVTPPPAHAVCEGARVLSDGELGTGDVLRSVAPAPACAGAGLSRAMFYRATVPARQTLTVTATCVGCTGAAPVIALLPSCGASSCLATSPRDAIRTSTARYQNAADVPRDVVIAVAMPAGSEDGAHQVGVSLSDPAAHGRCASALRVTDGAALRDERFVDGRDTPRACAAPTGESPSLYYAVRVGPGEELTFDVRASGLASPELRLLDTCEAATCLARLGADVAAFRPLTWTNAGAAPRDLIVALGSAEPAAAEARAAVSVAVRRPGYRVTTIPAACDDMTGATPYEIGTTFLGSTDRSSRPIPFGFTFFGETVRHWSATPYGALELWTDPVRDLGTGNPPLHELPNYQTSRLVAPFWAPLAVDWRRGILARVVDGPRRHLTVQWTSTRFMATESPPTDRATFQAWLLESGEVEFHYCAMAASPMGSGAVASIGLQGGTPTRGVSYAFRRAGAVMTGAGLRFGP